MINYSINSIAVLLIILCSLVGIAHAQEPSEISKINFLISSVEALEGAKFIRNGSEYDTQSASKHLHLKLKAAGDKIKTADDFIQFCASRSSMTGDPYLIIFADGTTQRSELFFREKLNTFASGKL